MNNNQINTLAQQRKQLRLFISSTFVDMDAERDALTRVFPQIEELCKQRGVEFIPLDLRWGITEEESKEGRVIETCLREIDESRPFFIGIIGNRYGWVPEEKDLGNFAEALQDRYPWIRQALDVSMSITEMEMQHAVLSRKDNEGMNAAFYLRSDSMSVDPSFKEIPGSVGERKLNELKAAVRNQKEFAARDYNSVDELAQMVLQDVKTFLYRVFPAQHHESYDEMAAKQELLLNKRLDSLFPLTRYQLKIDKWIENKETPNLLVTGKSGFGKSFMTAEIVNQLRKRKEKIVYIDISEQDNLVGALEHVFTELLFKMGVKTRKRAEKESNIGCLFSFIWMFIKMIFIGLTLPFRAAFGKPGSTEAYLKESITRSITSVTTNSLASLSKQLGKALRKHPDITLYVALDNLDGLSGEEMELLSILELTDRIRFIASASLNTNAQLYLQNKKSTGILEVRNLHVNQAASYINRFLSKYGKALDARGVQCGKLMKMGVSGNPLLLTHILTLMVRFGSFKELDNYIDELAVTRNESEVYELMLRHILKQFQTSRYFDDIKDITTAYALVKAGLSEREVKDIFKPKEFVWSMLHPYLYSIFRSKGNLRMPSSDVCRKVILNEMKDRVPAVLDKLIQYFENTLLCCTSHQDSLGAVDGTAIVDDAERTNRQVQVLPELYYEHDRIKELYSWVTYIKCDVRLSDEQRFRYWKKLHNAGIYLRNSGNVDVPPYYARIALHSIQYQLGSKPMKDHPYFEKLIRIHYNEHKWLTSGKDDLNAMYTRWCRVAGFICDPDDIKWVNVKCRVTNDVKENIEDANILVSITNALSSKEWDKVIATGMSANVQEQTRVFVNMFVASAYESKGELQTAYELAKSNTSLLVSLGLEGTKEALAIIYQYAMLSSRLGTMEDIDKALSLLTPHEEKDYVRNLSENNSMLFYLAMATVHLKKGNKDAAIGYAKVFRKIVISIGGSPQNADSIIEQAMALK